jgi:hypothetical protein
MRRNHKLILAALAVTVGCDAESSDDGAWVEGAKVVYELRYSPTGAFTIIEDADGAIAAGVRGRIGVDDARAGMIAIGRKTFEQAFIDLQPAGTPVPEVLRQLSLRLQAQRANLPAAAPDQLEPPDVPATLNKDRNGFLATACQTFVIGAETYIPNNCQFQYDTQRVCTNWTMDSGDISFGWNEGGAPARHSLSGSTTYYYTQGGHWGWVWWPGNYTNQRTCFTYQPPILEADTNLGVTHHDITTMPH